MCLSSGNFQLIPNAAMLAILDIGFILMMKSVMGEPRPAWSSMVCDRISKVEPTQFNLLSNDFEKFSLSKSAQLCALQTIFPDVGPVRLQDDLKPAR
jgi:hypothetical protein